MILFISVIQNGRVYWYEAVVFVGLYIIYMGGRRTGSVQLLRDLQTQNSACIFFRLSFKLMSIINHCVAVMWQNRRIRGVAERLSTRLCGTNSEKKPLLDAKVKVETDPFSNAADPDGTTGKNYCLFVTNEPQVDSFQIIRILETNHRS